MRMTRPFYETTLYVWGMSGLLLAASPTMADEAGPAAATGGSDSSVAVQHQEGSDLDVITVTARRRSERLEDVPIAINVIGGNQLQAAGVQTLRDLSQVVPGFNVTYFGAVPVPTLRGITSNSTAAGAENNIAIYSDGIYQSGIFGNTFDEPDISRVEVLKGPQGTLFGRNATGGAILIQTRDPEFTPSGSFSVTDGIFNAGGNDLRAGAFFTAPLSGTLAFSVAALYGNSDGYFHDVLRDERAGKVDSQYVRAKLLYRPNERLKILLNAYFNGGTDRAVFATQNINSPFPNTPSRPYDIANDTDGYVRSSGDGISVRADYETDTGTFSAVMAYDFATENYAGDVDGSPTPAIIYQGIQPRKTGQMDLSYSSNKMDGFSYVAGVNLYDHQEEFAPIAVRPSFNGPALYVIDSRQIARAAAAYAEANLDLTSKLTLTGGARYTYETRDLGGVIGADVAPAKLPGIAHTSFSAATPRVSLSYAASSDYTFFATYSEGFKSGLYDSSGLPTTAVRPEKLKSVEAGFKIHPLEALNVNASAFHYNVTNLQTQTNTASGLAILANAGAARIVGADFDINWHATRELTFIAAGTYIPKADYTSYTDAAFIAQLPGGGGENVTADLSGTRIAKTPRFQSNAQARYATDVDWGNIGGNVNVSYQSSFFYELSRFITQREFVLLNADVFWSPRNGKLRFNIWGKNLTNRLTINNTLVNATGAIVVYQAPREVGVGAAYTF